MDEKIFIYGAGNTGRRLYSFLEYVGYEKLIYGFIDRRANEIVSINGVRVYPVEKVYELQNVVAIPAIKDSKERSSVIEMLNENGIQCENEKYLSKYFIDGLTEYMRGYVAFYHDKSMDGYYSNAEDDAHMEIFWSNESPFFEFFQLLDLSNVIELACGHGRHVQKYLNDAGNITLVDILQSNIDFCKKRWEGIDKIKYYKNDGYDLKELETNTYTSLFCYDAMVHFEMMDIFSYLKDINRVLVDKGKALLHHSNLHDDYKVSFNTNRYGRNFMSKTLFAYLAYHSGFKIIDQKLIKWSGKEELDCISLIEKI